MAYCGRRFLKIVSKDKEIEEVRSKWDEDKMNSFTQCDPEVWIWMCPQLLESGREASAATVATAAAAMNLRLCGTFSKQRCWTGQPQWKRIVWVYQAVVYCNFTGYHKMGHVLCLKGNSRTSHTSRNGCLSVNMMCLLEVTILVYYQSIWPAFEMRVYIHI